MSRVAIIATVCAAALALSYLSARHLDFEAAGAVALALGFFTVYALGNLTGVLSVGGQPIRWIPVLLITAGVTAAFGWTEWLGRSMAR